MIDYPSVSLSGAIEVARARALWHDGMLRVFTKKGFVWETITAEPRVKRSRFMRYWIAHTSRGDLIMKGKCLTCGGWRNVTKIPAQQLWESR